MKNQNKGAYRFDHRGILLFTWALLLGASTASAADNAALVSVTVTNGTPFNPRTIFNQTWTIQNTGTSNWTAGSSGYTLQLSSWDALGAVPGGPNSSSIYVPYAVTGGAYGRYVVPGAQCSFTMTFIAPEASGSYTDTFQLHNASGAVVGPPFTVQISVKKSGSTNQYDRARAVSYANNYAGYIASDGYFWTNGSSYYHYGTNVGVPTNLIGDDCAHFCSCCIGSESHQRGAGLNIPSRVSPTYGEPGAGRLVNTCLIAPGYAEEVFSLSQLEPGDLIGWNWEGDDNIADLDHVTIYLGNGVLASHAASHLDVSATSWYQDEEPDWEWHLIHIFDAPTINFTKSGGKMVLSWGTNWTGYTLQASTALAGAPWTNVSGTPSKIGALNYLTNTTSQKTLYYRLMMP